MPVIKCPGCGSMISTKAIACPKCGYAVNGSMSNNSHTNNGGTPQTNYPPQQPVQQSYPPQQPVQQNYPPQYPTYPTAPTDKPKVILCILSFLFSVVGWILYFVHKNDAPNSAKAYSRWAWAGFGLYILSLILGS